MYPSIILSVFLGVLSVSGVIEAVPIEERRSVAPLAGAPFDSRAALLQDRSYGNSVNLILGARQGKKKDKEKAAEAARLEKVKEENRKANELKAQQEQERLAKTQKAQEAADQKKKAEVDAALKAQKDAAQAKANNRATIQAGVTVPAGVQATCGGDRVHRTEKLKEAITDALIRKQERGAELTKEEQPKVFGGVDELPESTKEKKVTIRDKLTQCNTSKQLREWPIFSGGGIDARFNPTSRDFGPDRVIFTVDGEYCGVVNHPPGDLSGFEICAGGV
ncbi:hypothetical protein DL96DRAFT_1684539 [Flagelloscypha sp. PMI_526]|nr:hypothetical protein DL96DRAFT_1684539 [Flagelloscypha sp. PMI_526]